MGDHVGFAVTKDGRVYGWGINLNCRLGLPICPSFGHKYASPELIGNFTNVVDVQSRIGMSVLLLNNGSVLE